MIEKQQIIIGYFRQGKSKKQLSKELKISRNTVRKYIQEYEAQKASSNSEKEKGIPPIFDIPKYNSSKRIKRSLTQEIAELIDYHLAANKIKQQKGKSKQQMKSIDIHEVLLEAGHKIGYTTVCNYVRANRKKEAEVFIRQHYQPGQQVEFDWGEVKLEINGVTKKLMLAVFTSAYSNHRWARLYYRQDMSSFLHSHACYFDAVGGVAQQVVYDNMKVAVRKYTLRNKDKLPTEDLLKIATYYQFDYRFCNARKGNEKGHVEKSVEYIRRKAFARKDIFVDLQSANKYLFEVNEKLNQRTVKGKNKSIADYFSEEIQQMRPTPNTYDTAAIRTLRVDKYSCIKIDTNYYSVPEGHVGTMLYTKIYPDRIDVYNAVNQYIANHFRQHTRFEYYLKIEHFLKTLATKPGAVQGSLTLAQGDKKLQSIFEKHFANRPKTFIELLIFLKKPTPQTPQGYSLNALQEAIFKCLKTCPHQAVCLEKLKILLPQQLDLENQEKEKITKTSTTKDTQQMSKTIADFCSNQLKDIQSLIQIAN